MEEDNVVSLRKLREEIEALKAKLALMDFESIEKLNRNVEVLDSAIETLSRSLSENTATIKSLLTETLSAIVPKLERIEAAITGYKPAEVKIEGVEIKGIEELKAAIEKQTELLQVLTQKLDEMVQTQNNLQAEINLPVELSQEIAAAIQQNLKELKVELKAEGMEETLQELQNTLEIIGKEVEKANGYLSKILEDFEAMYEAMKEFVEEYSRQNFHPGIEVKEEPRAEAGAKEKTEDRKDLSETLKEISTQNRELLESLNKLIEGMNRLKKLGEEL